MNLSPSLTHWVSTFIVQVDHFMKVFLNCIQWLNPALVPQIVEVQVLIEVTMKALLIPP